MKTYHITITGRTPLLMHQDNIEWSDFMQGWRDDPKNKTKSKAGDDRTPAWRWIGSVYNDGEQIVIPQGNLMRALMEGGVMVPVPGGGKKTFKAQTQSGMMITETAWPLMIDGAVIPWPEIAALQEETEFAEHKRAVRGRGFDLLVKRAKIGQSKHIRVRPQFPAGWQASGTVQVWDEAITLIVLQQIFAYAGRYKGLGDWRPGGKTPGPYGMFEADVRG